MRVYLDDVRNPKQPWLPWKRWTVVRTAEEAIRLINTGKVRVISLDHDLGTAKTGYDVACYIERAAALGVKIVPDVILVHSANPVGRDAILSCIRSIQRFKTQD